ncbi:MAG: hypothetical protein JWM39_37 [Parcubacteria group bacterium]|nr:hypothetical protein [Parcubacteria group bacterium]
MDYRVVMRTLGLEPHELCIKAGAAARPPIPEAQARRDAEVLVQGIANGQYSPKFYLMTFITRARKGTMIVDFPATMARSEKERRKGSVRAGAILAEEVHKQALERSA